MTRTPDEIYAEIRSVEHPSISKGAATAERLAYAEAVVAYYGRIESLWDEICEATMGDADVPMWAYAAACGAANYALECKRWAEERVELHRKELEQARAGTT